MSSQIRPALFKFLKDLKANNNREWFQANKERYETDVKDPLARFILEFANPLRKVSEEFIADPRRSMFRIYRDTRFSKDKTPYKTNAALHFRHVRSKDAHAPGFYLHLEPGNVFAGAGIWRPDTQTATRIREAIAGDPARWKRIRNKKFLDRFELHGESLKRPPRGFDADHPLIEELKRKDFIAVTGFTQKEACAPDFPKRFAETCNAAAPLVNFLTDALDLDF